MLPDLRIVIAAVVSTFIFTVGVGFFASSRLIHEQMTARVDTKGLDDTPINRIALNWPEPTKTERNVDLDFAITAKASRNPVREIAPEIVQDKPLPKTEAPSASVAPDTIAAPATQPADMVRDPEPTLSVAKAPDPVEEQPPAVTATESTADTRVIVHPDEATSVESTGSIAESTDSITESTTSDVPVVPIPESRPKFAARPIADENAPAAAKPALAEPAKAPVIRKKRPRRTAAKPRPQPAAQIPQLQPFDFFGLFRRPPQTQIRPLTLAPTPSTSSGL
jgi:hypothetical protein